MKHFFKAFFKTILACVLIAMLAAGGYAAFTISSAKSIDPTKIYDYIGQNSYMYDKDGELIDTLNSEEDREIISIEDMPANMKNAIIAIEDKTFYEHHGFNFRRMIGAIWSALRGNGGISGTSTITQQLARNVFLSDIKSQRSIRRKLIEMYYAFRIEEALSKDQILEAYLNTVYFGYGAYGVQSAAETYFSKDAKDMTLEECAALAALPQAPDAYALLQNGEGDKEVLDGIYSNDISKDRRFLVLDLMAEQQYISAEDAENAKTDLEDFLDPSFEKENSTTSYFRGYVISQVISGLMEEYDMTEDEAENLVYKGGIEIHSTLDSNVQNIIQEEFSDDYNFPWASEEPQAAMVITEVGTGKIIAMAGGRNPNGEHLFNRAINPRQPGSSIKPLSVYSAALQKSEDYQANGQKFPLSDYGVDNQGISGWGDYITAGSMVRDEKLIIDGKVWPYNASRRFTGYQTFRTALQQSINTCAVKIQLQVGNDYSMDMLKKFGITTLVEEGSVNDENPAALALGAMTQGVTPLEMSLAYAAFPNKGMRNSPICYTVVFDKNGEILLKGESKQTRVIDESVAWIMTDLLKSVVSRGIGRNAAISGVSVGGKTGTTNDQYDIWFDGFTPKYSAALWIGTDNNKQMSRMSDAAAALWSRIMRQIPDITEGEYPSRPGSVTVQGGEYYTFGTEPSSNTSIRPEPSARREAEPEDTDDVNAWFEQLVADGF